MIKNSTLMVLLCAILLGGGVYFYNSRASKESKPAENTALALSLPAADVTSFEISHPSKADQPTIRLEKVKDEWQIVSPVHTEADQSSAQGILDQVAALSESGTEPGTPDRLKAYGLDPGSVLLQLQSRNGTKHTVLMGDKDFTGSSVYSVVDGGKTVSLLPDLLLTSCDKAVDDLRDRAALHIDAGQVASFSLKDGSTELVAAKDTKDQGRWKFNKPEMAFADGDAVQAVLSAVQNAKLVTVDSEKADNLAKYRLASPAIVFTATNDVGQAFTLEIGKKDGSNYFARDLSRPMVFSVGDDLHIELSKDFDDLRDKKLAHFDPADIIHAEIRNDHGIITLEGQPDGAWQITSAGPQKGRNASSSKVFDPMMALGADKILDNPGANSIAALSEPGITIELTDKDKKSITLTLSKPVGDIVYARSSDSASIYQLKKAAFDSLNFDASQILP